MKQIKHILSFLLILILQLSFSNCNTFVFANKEAAVNNIELTETGKPIFEFSESDKGENYIFEHSFLKVVSYRNVSFFDDYAELIESWNVLGESADLRKNIDALETIEYYTKNVNSNVDELTSSFKSATNMEDWFSGKIAEIRSKARSLPGISTGNGVVIEGQWMRGTEGNIGLFPPTAASLQLVARRFGTAKKNNKMMNTEMCFYKLNPPQVKDLRQWRGFRNGRDIAEISQLQMN